MMTGACLSRAGLNRKTGLATLTLTLALEAPDIDSFTYFGGGITGLQHHRGITHSFVGAPFVALLVLAIAYGVNFCRQRWGAQSRGPDSVAASRGASRLPPNWKLLYGYALLGALIHLFQDFTNNYGVRPFAPFSEKWYAWDIVFIIDPIMLVALLLALTLPALRALNERTYRDQDPVRASAFPQMLNPFAWNGVVETRDFFQVLPVDSAAGEIDPQNIGVVRFKPEETPVTLAAKKSRLGRVYLDWARYPLVTAEQIEGGRNQVQFEDLRFESAEGLAQRRGPPLASYVVVDPHLRVEEMFTGRPPQA